MAGVGGVLCESLTSWELDCLKNALGGNYMIGPAKVQAWGTFRKGLIL